MFLIFPVFTVSVHLGIDFGSSFTKTSLVTTNGSPEIAMNYETKRITPTFVGFRTERSFNSSSTEPVSQNEALLMTPVFGNKAISIMSNRPWSGTGYLPLFLDIDESHAADVAKTLYVKPTAARFGLKDLMNFFFKFYIDCISHGKTVTSVTVAVPASYTVPQRKLIETAIRGSGFRFLKCIDDVEAIANVYAIEKTNKFVTEPRTVLFVDIGATSVKSFAVRFCIIKDASGSGRASAEKLSYSIINEQGGAFLTSKLAELIKTKLGLDKYTEAESRRIVDAAEKVKLQLTLLKQASVLIEEIGDDDRTVTITREELETEAADLIASVRSVIQEASNNITYDDVELLGGTSRIPVIQTTLQTELGLEFLGRSLNADEAIAVGAGYHAQFHAGLSRYQKVQINNTASVHTVTATVGNTTHVICEKNGNCTNEVSANYIVSEVVLAYNETEISEHLVTKSWGYKLDRDMNENQTLYIRFAECPTDVVYNNRGKLCNKTSGVSECSDVELKPLTPVFAASAIYHAVLKAEMTKKRLGAARNRLEQLALRVIDELENNATVRTFTNEEQRTKISTKAEDIKQWIWDNADSVTDEANFTQKHTVLREAILPVYTRIAENRTLTRSFQVMLQTLQVARYSALLEWPVNKSYINKTEILDFTKLLNATETWCLETLKENGEIPLWEKRTVTPAEIENKTRTLYKEMLRINSIKKPPSALKKTATGWMHRFKNWVRNKVAKVKPAPARPTPTPAPQKQTPAPTPVPPKQTPAPTPVPQKQTPAPEPTSGKPESAEL